jgi:hypothetical protein
MICFHHADRPAVGVCKNCGRGLCRSCAVDVGNGLACPGACEEEARALNRVIARNKTAYEKTSGAYLRVAAFYLALAAVCLAGAVLDWRGFGWILYPASAIFTLSAFVHYSTSRRFERD